MASAHHGYGKPRHPQSKESVERAHGDLKDILVAWMSENSAQDLTVGLKYVEQQKQKKQNSAHHADINRIPTKPC